MQADERGVSEILGGILLFALLIALIVLAQVTLVPVLTQTAEYEHDQRLQGDFQRFGENAARIGSTGGGESLSVELGAPDPVPVPLIGHSDISGQIRTDGSVGGGEIAVENAVRDVDDPATDEYWADASDPSETSRSFPTGILSYRASYNQYNAPATYYEYGVLYGQTDSGVSVVRGTGPVVSGDRISLVLLDGQLSKTGSGPNVVEMVPTSAPSKTTTVQSADGDPITITIPTRLSENAWREEVLAEEYDPGGTTDGRHVQAVSCTTGAPADQPCNGDLEITLEGTENGDLVTYELRMTEIGVGSGFDRESAAYVTKVTKSSSQIQPGGSAVTVEVRDRYNNPVPGEAVTFTVSNGAIRPDTDGTAGVETVTTGDDGRATVTVVPGATATSVDVQAGRDTDGDGALDPATDGKYNVVTYTSLSVASGGGSPTGGGDVVSAINPAPGSGFPMLTRNGGNNAISTLTFVNDGTTPWIVEEARISFYYTTGTGSDPASADISNGTVAAGNNVIKNGNVLATLPVEGAFQPLDPNNLVQFAPTPGSERYFHLAFTSNIQNNDFYVISLVLDDGQGNKELVSYFVDP